MNQLYALFSIAFVSISGLAPAQTATSINNGNWTNPFTWDCTCVPVNGYTVTINHNVTLNTSMSFSTGGINIGGVGSLVQDASANRDIWINGGTFSNSGTANFRYFLLSTGSGSNAGTFTINAFSNAATFNNAGTIYMDSMEVQTIFNNFPTGQVFGDSIHNMGILTNDGRMNIVWATNSNLWYNNNYQSGFSMTNLGNYQNGDTLLLSNSLLNANKFWNKPNSVLITYNDFFNTNTVNNSSFNNDGAVNVYDSWYNTDTIKGGSSGSYTVNDTSANSGIMKGNFNFCDNTPPPSAPFVDLNSGSIDPTITWCTGVGLKEYKDETSLLVFPNPNDGNFSLKGLKKSTLTISDELGRVIQSIEHTENNMFKSEITNLPAGIYFLSSDEKMFRQKIVVTK